jgi:hypothetical protein
MEPSEMELETDGIRDRKKEIENESMINREYTKGERRRSRLR